MHTPVVVMFWAPCLKQMQNSQHGRDILLRNTRRVIQLTEHNFIFDSIPAIRDDISSVFTDSR